MKMDVLRCETVAGVSKELLMYALAYNLVRLVMLEASRRQGVAVDRNQFRGRAALAGGGAARRVVAGVGGQPRPPRPRGAAGPQASPQTVPVDEESSIRIA